MARARVRPGRASLALVLALVACGPQATGARSTDSADRSGALPPTDSDPGSYVPPPADQAQTGAAVGVATTGGFDQARAVAIRFLVAVRDGDEVTLGRVLSERVGRVFPRLAGPSRDRDDIVAGIVRNPRRQGLGPDVALEQLADTTRMQVTPLASREGQPAIPPGLAGDDLLVTFPLQAEGRTRLRSILGWGSEGALVVRPGAAPEVVAL